MEPNYIITVTSGSPKIRGEEDTNPSVMDTKMQFAVLLAQYSRERSQREFEACLEAKKLIAEGGRAKIQTLTSHMDMLEGKVETSKKEQDNWQQFMKSEWAEIAALQAESASQAAAFLQAAETSSAEYAAYRAQNGL